MTSNNQNRNQGNLSDAAAKMRRGNDQERSEAASEMGRAGGSSSQGGGRQGSQNR
jgi:hypothetical protein